MWVIDGWVGEWVIGSNKNHNHKRAFIVHTQTLTHISPPAIRTDDGRRGAPAVEVVS